MAAQAGRQAGRFGSSSSKKSHPPAGRWHVGRHENLLKEWAVWEAAHLHDLERWWHPVPRCPQGQVSKAWEKQCSPAAVQNTQLQVCSEFGGRCSWVKGGRYGVGGIRR